MRMTDLRPATPDDEDRARYILKTLRSSLVRYKNYRVALAKGMRIFLPGIPQDVYHFTDYAQTGQEYQGRFDLAHPGSLLYAKNPDGEYTLVGAMYSAPPDALAARSRRDRAVEHCAMARRIRTFVCPTISPSAILTAQRCGRRSRESAGHAAGFGGAERGRVESSLRLSRRWTLRLRRKNLPTRGNALRLAAIWSSRPSAGWSTSILSRAKI